MGSPGAASSWSHEVLCFLPLTAHGNPMGGHYRESWFTDRELRGHEHSHKAGTQQSTAHQPTCCLGRGDKGSRTVGGRSQHRKERPPTLGETPSGLFMCPASIRVTLLCLGRRALLHFIVWTENIHQGWAGKGDRTGTLALQKQWESLTFLRDVMELNASRVCRTSDGGQCTSARSVGGGRGLRAELGPRPMSTGGGSPEQAPSLLLALGGMWHSRPGLHPAP